LQLLVRLKSTNKIIIITSHIIESLTRICDRISLIEHGLIKTTFEKNEFPILEKELKDSIKLKIDDVL
jgi:ABC-2 type transport system ATP-binding protein